MTYVIVRMAAMFESESSGKFSSGVCNESGVTVFNHSYSARLSAASIAPQYHITLRFLTPHHLIIRRTLELHLTDSFDLSFLSLCHFLSVHGHRGLPEPSVCRSKTGLRVHSVAPTHVSCRTPGRDESTVLFVIDPFPFLLLRFPAPSDPQPPPHACPPPQGDTTAALKTGVVLCRLLNCIQPRAVPKIATTASPFHQRENLKAFLAVAEAWGVPSAELFAVDDLYDGRPARGCRGFLGAGWMVQ